MNRHHTNGATPADPLAKALARLFQPDDGAAELLLVRHAEPNAAANAEASLSALGRAQAAHLAQRLRHARIDAVYASPARCAVETARAIADASGAPLSDVANLRGIDVDARALATIAPTGHGLAETLASRFEERASWDALPGLEPRRAFRHRAIQALEAVLARHAHGRAVVITHASVINAYLSMLLEVPRDMFFLPEHASISTVRFQDGRYALRTLNDCSHLTTTPNAQPALAR